MERKVNQLSQTSSLLTKKVTGVNFYLKDIASSNSKKPQPSTTQYNHSNLSKGSKENSPHRPMKSNDFIIIKQQAKEEQHSVQPKIFIKDNSKTDVKILLPHPPLDLMKKGPTNFSQLKSPALVSLEHNMREINEKLRQPVNYKKFFWTPDLSVCGFGTSKEIK
jgi:hypothetical protein